MNLYRNIKKPESLWLATILAIAAGLRFYRYGSFSYSNDELSALNRLHYSTFSELVAKGFYVDGHPGGIQIFLWKWVAWFGDTERIVRLPFVLLGIIAVWMSYKVAKKMFGTAAGLYTAAALTFLQFPLLYSQIARPYGPGMLFGLMLVYFWLQVFFTDHGKLNPDKPKMKHLAGFVLSASLCMYNHYFSFLFALIVGLSGFVVSRRHNIFLYIAAALLTVLLFVPHIPITLNHLTYKGVGLWLGVPGKSWIFEHLYFIFDKSTYTLILFLIILLILNYLNTELKSSLRFKLFLAVWFLLPILVGYIYSVKVNPVLQHPVLIFSFPYLIILIFSNAGKEFEKKKRWLLAFFLAAGVTGTTAINKYYQQQHFGEFKDIATLAIQWQKEFGNDSITKVISVNSPFYIDFYLQKNNSEIKFDLYDINGSEGLELLSDIVRKSRKPYFLYALTKPAPGEGEDIIRSFYPYIVDMKVYGAFSSIILFGKETGKPYGQASHLTEIKLLKASLNADNWSVIDAIHPEKAFKMDSVSEYSPGIEVQLDDFGKTNKLTIIAETDFLTPDNCGEALLVISVETEDGISLQWEGAAAKYTEIPGKWSHLINTFRTETDVPKGAKLKAYFWNKDKRTVYLRNLKCSIYR